MGVGAGGNTITLILNIDYEYTLWPGCVGDKGANGGTTPSPNTYTHTF